jgi:Domain of Unknown Function (DUF1206)
MSAGQQARHAQRAAREAVDSGPIRTLGRVGLAAYGVVHLLIAWLALRIATGGGGKASKSGALRTIAEQPAGRLLLWVIAAGLAALTLWQAAEAAWGHRRRQGRRRTVQRLVSAGEALLAGVLAFSAGRVAAGGSADTSDEKAGLVDGALELPGGQLLVAAAGLAVVGVSLYLVWRGVTKRFVEDLDLAGADRRARQLAVRLGQAGWAALGVAYGIVGLLLVAAAVTHDPKKATGTDTALKTLAAQPYGVALLLAVAAGLACFGLYCLLDARYRRG